ncbi:site-specific DNA-methyltransferase [Hymenobacter coalescens]
MDPITAQDPLARSADLAAAHLARLRAALPEAFTDGKVDLAVLRQLLGEDNVETQEEKYGLTWHGKRRARQLALQPSTATLRPAPEDSVAWDTTQNLVLEGDNLEVLKLLQKSYAGQVKLIYIDPPYNTGKDFVYPDNFQHSLRRYQELTGQPAAGAGRKLAANTEASGRFHTDWLNMMYPRLHLARHLLRDDGVLFVSIDDHEVENTGRLLNEIFGEENRLAIICHKARASVSNDKIISANHNFILLYAKDQAKIFGRRAAFGLPPDLKGFKLSDERGPYKHVPVDGPGGAAKGNPHYTFLGVTGYFRYSQERMQAMYEQGLIVKAGKGLQQKHYRRDSEQARKTDTTWWDDKYYTATATARLKALMQADVFDTPKPVELVERMLQLWAREPNDLILDFFAGSGTTGHAVMAQNAADGGSRRYLLVQLPEPLRAANRHQKAAAAYCDRLGRPRTIAELTKERLRRAARKVQADHPAFRGDLGFRVYRLDTSNLRAWDPSPADLEAELLAAQDQLKPGRTDQDLLTELALKRGLPLTAPVQARAVAGHTLYAVAGGALLACLSARIGPAEVEALALNLAAWRAELAPEGETQVVLRDSAFRSEAAKANFTAILVQAGFERRLIRSL